MSVVFNAPVGSSGGIDVGDIGHSLRFRSSASAYLSRTFVTPTDNTKFYLAVGLKRGATGASQTIISSYGGDANNFSQIYFDATDHIVMSSIYGGVLGANATTVAVFRDTTAHLLLEFLWDGSLSTANKAQIWVNGARQSVTGTNGSATVWHGNTAVPNGIGRTPSGTNQADFYISRCCGIDGSSLTLPIVGYLNTSINEWVSKSQAEVKAVVDAGGTNSFMLDFDDATNLTTLGYDCSTSNYCTYSEQFDNAAWVKYQSSITANAVTAPDSTTTADKLVETATTGDHQVYQNIAAADSTDYCFSVYAKAGEKSTLRMYLQNKAGTYNYSDFNLATGTLGSGTGVTAKISVVGSGWYRCSVSANSGTGATSSPAAILSHSTTGTGDGTSGLYIWGAQLEARAISPSEYIATVTTSKTKNDWTCNNISLTAGVTYDHMLDVPGNSYATWNPVEPSSSTLQYANLQAVGSLDAYGTISVSSGAWVVEGVVAQLITNTSSMAFGIVDLSDPTNTRYIRSRTSDSIARTTSSAESGSFSAFANNDVISLYFDIDNDTFAIYKNGTLVAQSVGGAGLSGKTWKVKGGLQAAATLGNWQIMAGQAPLSSGAAYYPAAGGYFKYEPPTGFKALCQANLPDPAILNPEEHFDVALYTTTGSQVTVSTIEFDPGWMLNKARNLTQDWFSSDEVTGWDKYLSTNLTAAEGSTTYITSADPGAVVMAAETAGRTRAIFGWKAGGAGVSTTDGSITSTVSANPEAGFSIVTYTGNGIAGATVGHGLGVAPKMVIVKNRDNAGYSWGVWHTGIAATEYLLLNSTAAKATGAMWNNTAPSSTVVTLGASTWGVNEAQHIVAYCFAEIPGYSKFGKYTGNGSADGPFVYCGFKPKYVLIKNISSAANWMIVDAAREPENVLDIRIYPNLSNADNPGTAVADFTANGFKIRGATNDENGNTNTIIFGAFADVPGKFSNAR